MSQQGNMSNAVGVSDKSFRSVLLATVSETGIEMFRAVVKALCDELGAIHGHIAFARDLRPGRIKVVAAFKNGGFRDGGEFELADSPLSGVYESRQQACLVLDADGRLARPGEQTQICLAFPLSVRDLPVGHLALYFSSQLENQEAVLSSCKPVCVRLEAEMHRLLAEHEASSVLKALEVENELLRLVSRTDPLTGLANRRAFIERAEIESRRARRTSSPLGVLYLDLDHFRQLNERFGQGAADQVLVRTAKILSAAVRADTDLSARIGGEELAVLLPGAQRDICLRISDAIRRSVELCTLPEIPEMRFTCSIGVGLLDSDKFDWEAMLIQAEMNLLAAKASGRNCVVA